VIQSFASRETERLFRDGVSTARWRAIESVALEALKGSRRGQWSIRINDQWRICFRWIAEGPTAVEIVDYH
jgi:proteic killer suppression protein